MYHVPQDNLKIVQILGLNVILLLFKCLRKNIYVSAILTIPFLPSVSLMFRFLRPALPEISSMAIIYTKTQVVKNIKK